MSLLIQDGKGLQSNDLQNYGNSVPPNASPEIEKGAILDALRGMSKDDLLNLLASVLADKGTGS